MEKVSYGVLLPGVGVFGGVRRFIEVGNELVRRGNRYTIYHPDGAPPDWLPFHGETRPLAALGEARHDVLICNDPPLVPAFHAATARLKLFYFALEGIPGEARIARSGAWVPVANSSGMASYLRRRYRVRAETAIGGIDPGTFHLPAEKRVQGEETRVLAFGRASRRRKGVALVVPAVQRLADLVRARGGAPVKLVMFDHVGAGNELDPRDEIRTSLPVEFHVNPSQADLAALYASCAFFVSAEKRAGWSNTVAEAMACGTPVVCTRSGTRDLALPRETAWVTRWRHPFFLARGLKELYRDPALAGRLAAAAHARVQRFAWPFVVDQLEEIVGRRLAGGAQPINRG